MENTTTRTTVIATLMFLLAIAIGFFAGANMDNSETTPEACLTALDDAETTQQLAGTGFYLMTSVIKSLDYGDYYAAERSATEFAETTEQVVEAMDEYDASAAACRALADD